MKLSITIFLLTGLSLAVLGQGPGAPPATPIDGGLLVLLASGAALGIRRIIKSR
ncbi:PID-CTERM protein-sorting domain-containing protein [Marinoscillum furvescens]|nr:hypothetical protein [Marinoscillum furvescens]